MKQGWLQTNNLIVAPARIILYEHLQRYEVIEDGDDDDEDCSDFSGSSSYVPPSYSPPSKPHYAEPSCPKKEKKLPDGDLRKQRIIAFLFKRKKIHINYSYMDLLGKHIDDVETILVNQAFNNIKKYPSKMFMWTLHTALGKSNK